MRVVLIDAALPVLPGSKPGWAPLGLAYLAAVLRQEDHQVHIHNRQMVRRRCASQTALDQQTASLLREVQPELVGIGGPTATFGDMQTAARLAREHAPGASIVVGGAHATILPAETLERIPEADYVIVGEAEGALADLASGRPASELPGVHWRGDDGRPRHTAWQAPNWDLDSLPFPARDLLDMRWYASANNNGILGTCRCAITMVSSRGCRHRCAFCAEPAWTVRGVRYHSPAYTVAEAEAVLAAYPADAFYFLDEAFTSNRERVLQFAELWQRHGLNQRAVFAVQARVDAVDAEMLCALKQAGCVQVDLGLESGAQRMLDLMCKGTTVEQNEQAVDLVKRAGIRVFGNFVVGAPGETEESFRETVSFIDRTDPELVSLHRFVPIPGTAFTRQLVAAGRLAEDFWARPPEGAVPVDYSGMPAGRLHTLWGEVHGRLVDERSNRAWMADAPPWRRIRPRVGAVLRRLGLLRQTRPSSGTEIKG